MNKALSAAVMMVSLSSVYADDLPTTSPVKATDPFETPETIAVPAADAKAVKPTDVQYDLAQGTVEIHVNEANVVEVLRMLSAQSQKNIIASKDVKGTVTANLYGVTVKEALDAILASNGYAYRERGNFIFVYTVKELHDIERASRTLKTEVFRLFYTPAANAVNMIKPVLSPDAQVSFTTPAQSGISSGTGDVGGNSHAIEDMMVVTDYAENIDAVKRVLKEVDRRPQQILIEATILRASLSEDNALGVDFNLLAGVDLQNFTTNQGQISGANTADGGTVGANKVSSVGTGNSFSSSVPGGLKVGFVSNSVSVFLSALEGVTDTVVMANPKILALNKQKGEVIVGRKDGYLTTTVTESSTVQTVEFLDTGTRLIFRPYIGDDGYVRMEIHPEDSSGGLSGANLPFKITTEVTSNIMVKDGHTVVIGGLFREATDTAKSQIPILGNLPMVGNLFGQQRDRTVREEIIILLTPHVIKDDVAFAGASAEMAADGERLRVGVRRGMMPWGRQRLAEMSYEWAQDEMKKPSPDRGKMMWHLDCATNLNPSFIEAIKLKEQITGQTVAMNDHSSMRSFIRRQVAVDQANGTTLFVPPPSTPIERGAVSSTQPMDEVPSTQPVENTPVAPVMPAVQQADVESNAPATEPPAPQTTVTVLPDEPTVEPIMP